MTSIPADPSMVLGNYVDPEKIKHLMKIAQAQQPEETANDRLQELILASYRFKMIKDNLSSMNCPTKAMDKLEVNIQKLMSEMAEAAVDLATAAMTCADKVEELEEQFGQTAISYVAESPLDYALVDVKKFALSSDTMKFDVQYFKTDTNNEDTDSHAKNVSSYVQQNKANTGVTGPTQNAASGTSIQSLVSNHTTNHVIEGTIVITANCTHRMADMITPVIMEPMKLLNSWNSTFADDYLDTDVTVMFDVATEKTKSKNPGNKLNLLTGCTRGSSFVGMVHILQTDKTTQTGSNEVVAAEMAKKLQTNLITEAAMGNFGVGSNYANEVQSLLGTSNIQSHCTLTTMGVIADIASNTYSTNMMQLNPDPKKIMTNLTAMTESAAGRIKPSAAGDAATARSEQQAKQMHSSYQSSMATTLTKIDTQADQVFDTNSLMTAFTNYVQKCEAGGVGVPINFYIKEIDKAMVAKEYIKKFYPNGAQTMEDNRRGLLGQTPEAK